jgi:hypothetical protein
MADKTRLEKLLTFEAAPANALFDQDTIAALRGVSIRTIERDRCLGRGVPFVKIGHGVRYRKRDYLLWEQQHQSVHSTIEARAQRRLREALSDAPPSPASAERHKPIRPTAEADAQASQLRVAAHNVAVEVSREG